MPDVVQSRADNIVALCGCSKAAALLAAEAVPAPADIDEAIDFLLLSSPYLHTDEAVAVDHDSSGCKYPMAQWEMVSGRGSASLCSFTELPFAGSMQRIDGTLCLQRMADSQVVQILPTPAGGAAGETIQSSEAAAMEKTLSKTEGKSVAGGGPLSARQTASAPHKQ